MNMAESDIEKDLEKLKEKEKQMMNEKHESELAFGQQRAKFMELFKQKEDELNSVKDLNHGLEVKNMELQEELKKLSLLIDEVKSESTILEVNKDDELARIEQRHCDEAASFQHILKESVDQAYESASNKYAEERGQWLHMQQELQELKAKVTSESEGGTLSNLARSLQKRMHLLRKEEPENLENSMIKAQEDIELLRSVVSPLEDEISHLKRELHSKTEEMTSYVKQNKAAPVDTSVDVKKRKELSQSMQSERASRTDLEMYVTVLNIQKEVLHNDNNNIKISLNKAEGLLERERMRSGLLQEHITALEETTRLRGEMEKMDEARVCAILNDAQSNEYHAYKEEDETRKNLSEALEGVEGRRGEWLDRLQVIKDQGMSTSSSTSASTDILDDSSQQQDESSHQATQQEGLHKSTTQQLQQQQYLEDESLHSDTPSHGCHAESSQLPQQQQQSQLTQQNLQHSINTSLVSEKDWRRIQNDVDAARGKLGRQCVRCGQLEGELRGEKEESKRTQGEVVTMGKLLDQERAALANKDEYIKELETNLQTVMENSDGQISTLHSRLVESEKFMKSFREQYERGKLELFDYLKNLGTDRQSIQKELNRLQAENDSLVEKHARKAQEMQEEVINLPSNLEDMQLMLLKYREELITCRVSLEHSRESMAGEVAFLKSRLEAEQQERVVMEDTLTQELSQLQNQLDVQRQLAEELEKERKRRVEEEGRRVVVEAEGSKKDKLIEAHQFEFKQLNSVKAKLEKTVAELRNKIHGLQVDLDNSEDVQRDFVKLSQTLQIQLEKIRAVETEVRWQHDDDVHQCPSCKASLSTPNKYHCRHCGHIFCQACLSRSVPSGPSLRPSRVCDVCHTMLVKSATPFFSRDPSHRHNHQNELPNNNDA